MSISSVAQGGISAMGVEAGGVREELEDARTRDSNAERHRKRQRRKIIIYCSFEISKGNATGIEPQICIEIKPSIIGGISGIRGGPMLRLVTRCEIRIAAIEDTLVKTRDYEK